MNDKELKLAIQSAVKNFCIEDISNCSISLFKVLGYNTDRQNPFPYKTFDYFKESFLDVDSRFDVNKALVDEWKSVDILFQLTKDEVSDQKYLFDKMKIDNTIIETYLFFSIELNNSDYSRTALAQITREINKIFPMPVMVIFKHGDKITLSVINRRLHKRDSQKDVLEKVTLIKDISCENPHRAHIEILFDLSFPELLRIHKFTNFVELHIAWKKTLDTKELNKRFYRELSDWYFWAMHEVYFPGASIESDKKTIFQKEEKVREHNAKNLIRLLTRILFVWFIKEKSLIPEELFDETYIKEKLISGFEPRKKNNFDHKAQGSKYYRAILQNLFFATLNQTVGKREFRKEGQQMNVTNLMRYESYFKDPKAFLKMVEEVVPFMNGGLFECLDSPDPILKGKKGGDVINYEDGFSDKKDNSLCVPDYIFFGIDEHADLSEEYGDKKQKDVTVSGLINILKSYKFTVTENTPIEEDIALDPELLGRVFENLLASYNPETKTTARKQTGSFYTPREIVNYMVDESLKAYLKQKLESEASMEPDHAEKGLDYLIGYNEKGYDYFDEKQTSLLINAIDSCKILDPACGSGAFPMGVLHKLVHVLHKLDPNNEKWRNIQRQKAIKETEEAFKIGNKQEREDRLKEISDVFEYNSDDYGRKLYLIENCIYGVDIQPIATQISKLRFFISLIVDQKTLKSRDNFGVRPLPNLETKFVAANTLIGIEKPKEQGSLFDNTKIQCLEEKIKDVRHRLFSAKTPTTKRKLREEDQSLREEMGSLLEDSGWCNATARQLAGWDPYSQIVSSPFFDPEWMFGIEDGFDVLIGNPPYVNIKGQNEETKEALRKGYKYSRGADVYVAFIEKSLQLNKAAGNLHFIVPNKFFGADYGKSIREYLNNGDVSILSIWDLKDEKVFENAMISTIVIGFKKSRKVGSTKLIQGDNVRFVEELFDVEGKIQIEANDNDNIILAKLRLNPHLQTVAAIRTGIMGFEYWKMEPIIHNGIKKNTVRLYTNGNLSKYSDKWDNANIKLYKDEYSKPSIELNKSYLNSNTIELFKHKPKIIVRGVSKEIAAIIDDTGSGLLVAVHSIIPKSINIKYLLGLINSSLLNWFHLNTIYSIRIPQGSLKYPTSFFETLPIAIGDNASCKEVELLVDKILVMKISDTDSDTSKYEKQIDELVYKLYNLNEEEIAIIKGSVK